MTRKLNVRVLVGIVFVVGIAVGCFVTQTWGQASGSKQKPAVAPKSGEKAEKKSDSEFKNEVFREVDDALKNAKLDDLGTEDRKTFREELDKIRKDLLKHDKSYTRIKEQNAAALQRANTPARIRGRSIPGKVPVAPQPEAAPKAEAAPKPAAPKDK